MSRPMGGRPSRRPARGSSGHGWQMAPQHGRAHVSGERRSQCGHGGWFACLHIHAEQPWRAVTMRRGESALWRSNGRVPVLSTCHAVTRGALVSYSIRQLPTPSLAAALLPRRRPRNCFSLSTHRTQPRTLVSGPHTPAEAAASSPAPQQRGGTHCSAKEGDADTSGGALPRRQSIGHRLSL